VLVDDLVGYYDTMGLAGNATLLVLAFVVRGVLLKVPALKLVKVFVLLRSVRLTCHSQKPHHRSNT